MFSAFATVNAFVALERADVCARVSDRRDCDERERDER